MQTINDFYAWTQVQVSLLKTGNWQLLDIPNLIDEVESLGKQQRQELRNRLAILIGHLLKWQYQPDYRSNLSLVNHDNHNDRSLKPRSGLRTLAGSNHIYRLFIFNGDDTIGKALFCADIGLADGKDPMQWDQLT